MNTGNEGEMRGKGEASSQQLTRPGPQTPEAKRRSSQNARTHGILASVLERDGCLGDSQSLFSKLLAELRNHFEPVGFLENLLVEKLTVLYLRLAVVYKSDLKVAPLMFGKVEAGLRGEEPLTVTGLFNSELETSLVRKLPTPEVLMRYETNIERNIERTLHQLERLQRTRLGQPVPPPVKVELSA